MPKIRGAQQGITHLESREFPISAVSHRSSDAPAPTARYYPLLVGLSSVRPDRLESMSRPVSHLLHRPRFHVASGNRAVSLSVSMEGMSIVEGVDWVGSPVWVQRRRIG
jgi:hypothetical protein